MREPLPSFRLPCLLSATVVPALRCNSPFCPVEANLNKQQLGLGIPKGRRAVSPQREGVWP